MMRNRESFDLIGLAVALVLLAVAAHSQTISPVTEIDRHSIASSRATEPAADEDVRTVQGEKLREIEDPNLGDRWELYRELNHPGGPGRWIRASIGKFRAGAQGLAEVARADPPTIPVIRMGDRVVVEEDTARVEERLEAVALGSAVTGSVVQVRLKIGGQVMHAMVVAAGRARFVAWAEPEVRP
jgi:hypothetical protein